MKASRRASFPVAAFLREYASAGLAPVDVLMALPGLGPRFQAIRSAPDEWLSPAFLDDASPAQFETALVAFYKACVPQALHTETLRGRLGLLRHGLAHLLRCREPLACKIERFLDADGTYHVVGLGPAFWSAVFQALAPQSYPAWLPCTLLALQRLGLLPPALPARPAEVYAACCRAGERLRVIEPALTSEHIDHFLCLVAGLQGRDLTAAAADLEATVAGGDLLERVPLHAAPVAQYRAARQQLETGLSLQQGPTLTAALAAIGIPESRLESVDWYADAEELTLWIGRLWEADEPFEILEYFWQAEPVAGAGLWLPPAVLHLRDPRHFHCWDEVARQTWSQLDDAAAGAKSATERYRLFNEAANQLAGRKLRFRQSEDTSVTPRTPPERSAFGGFCADTFRFLADLEQHNSRAWMEEHRGRYRFAVRGPVVELCRALAARYVEPILRRQYGWDIEAAACNGRALTSICKNNYGRAAPYTPVLWITFYPRHPGRAALRREDVQFFVRLDAKAVSFGFRLGADAREARRHFRDNLGQQADVVYRLLHQRGALTDCRFDSGAGVPVKVSDAEALRAWAAGRSPMAACTLPAEASLLRTDELVGAILLTFDRLLPLFALAAEPDPVPVLNRLAGTMPSPSFSAAAFQAATFLSDDWLGRARALLDLKRQLILQGVPGTGKTHVARCLARLLTGGRDEAIRLVQFHPAYSYEEFVEGIKVRSVEAGGRHDVTYPVEDGLLCAFAAEAARHPDQPNVLIIDEINRGNLPRICGELLYLLEYRNESVELPYSRRSFQLPANLYLIGTMNAADRSVAQVDQALRRRFSFLDMPPDAEVLAAWLRAHPPAEGQAFADSVVALLDRLNAHLRADVGPQFQVGHSYFMVPDLDPARLRILWKHQIEPLLAEYFANQPDRAASYRLADLLADRPAAARRSPAARSST